MTDEFRQRLIFLFIAAAIMLAAGIGLRDPWPADEPRFALIAKEMVESGRWLFPHVGGDLYPDKPPLFFWLIAFFYALTGSLRFAFLAPGFIAGLGVLWLVTDLARRLWDERAAFYCGATLLVMMQFGLQMKAGQIDALLCLWTTLSFYGLCRHLLLGPDWRWYLTGGVAAGLGVITKGVGILPYLVLLPYVFGLRRGWPVTRVPGFNARWLLAPAGTLLAIGAWLLPMLLVVANSNDAGLIEYRDNILFHQTVTRYADSWGHIKPPWYLLTNAIPWLWLPVTVLLPWLIPAWRRDLKDRNAAVLLIGSWVLLVVLFFSLSSGKRSLYIFPAAPAVALLAGLHAQALLERRGVRIALLALALVIGGLLTATGAWALLNPGELVKELGDIDIIKAAGFAVLCIGVLVLMIAGWFRVQRAALAYLLVMLVLWSGLGLGLAPAITDIRSGAALMTTLDAQLGDEERLAFVAWPEQFLLHWPRPAVNFGHRRETEAEMAEAVHWAKLDANRRVLVPDYLIEPCFDPSRAALVGYAHRREWYLVGRDAISENCSAHPCCDGD